MKWLLILLGLVTSGCRAAPGAPPNWVPISERIVTSGQPSAAWLETLREQKFDAVVYLAPPTVHDAVREEPFIVGRQGLLFASVPIVFDRPTAEDFARFAGILRALDGRRVLVHCQINLRASAMTFLYRVIHRGEAPAAAYESVTRVWAPNPVWREFIAAQLRAHRIDFDPF